MESSNTTPSSVSSSSQLLQLFRGAGQRSTKKAWTSKEDAKLMALIDVHGVGQWTRIAEEFESPPRTGKQCRERYHNHLQPDINKGEWTEEEDLQLLELHAKLGNQWSKISKEMVGRSDNAIKNRWHTAHRGIRAATSSVVDKANDVNKELEIDLMLLYHDHSHGHDVEAAVEEVIARPRATTAKPAKALKIVTGADESMPPPKSSVPRSTKAPPRASNSRVQQKDPWSLRQSSSGTPSDIFSPPSTCRSTTDNVFSFALASCKSQSSEQATSDPDLTSELFSFFESSKFLSDGCAAFTGSKACFDNPDISPLSEVSNGSSSFFEDVEAREEMYGSFPSPADSPTISLYSSESSVCSRGALSIDVDGFGAGKSSSSMKSGGFSPLVSDGMEDIDDFFETENDDGNVCEGDLLVKGSPCIRRKGKKSQKWSPNVTGNPRFALGFSDKTFQSFSYKSSGFGQSPLRSPLPSPGTPLLCKKRRE